MAPTILKKQDWCQKKEEWCPRAKSDAGPFKSSGPAARLDHVVERAQPCPRRVDQHCHVAGRMPIGAHQFVGMRNLGPGKHFAHAGADAAVEHELIRCRGLLEMSEMRTLDGLLPHPHETRGEGDVVA